MATTDVKCCTKCGESKQVFEFPSDKQKRDGFSSHCKCCKRAAYAEYHKAHPEKAMERDRRLVERQPDYHRTKRRTHYLANTEKTKAQTAIWRGANLDRVRQSAIALYAASPTAKVVKRKYRDENAERLRELGLAYRTANKDAINERSRQWAKDNPARHRAHRARRRAAELQATPAWADREAILAVYEEARAAEAADGITRHVDHKVPLQSDIVCGLHVVANLEVVIDVENRKKGNRHWPDMP